MKPIVGDRVSIREYVLADRDAYADWQCDPKVAEFLSWLPVSKEEAYQCLQEAIEQQGIEDRTQFFMAVVRREDQEVVGNVGIERLEEHVGSIGWFIRSEYWGLGYASEAAALMIRCGFEVIGLDTIRASCRRGNTRSERIMQKCSLQLTDATESRLHYALNRCDWKP